MKRSNAPSSVAKRARSSAKTARNIQSFRVPRNALKFAGTGFPKQLAISHKYFDSKQITVSTGANVTYETFRCNGMYDPDATIAYGHQPGYFDQVGGLYRHYHVMSSIIKVEFTVKASTASSDITRTTCGILIDDDSTPAYTNANTMCEQASSVHAVCTTFNKLTLYKKWDAKSAFGVGGPAMMANTSLQGSALADPTEQQTWIVFCNSPNAATAVTVRMDVSIIYNAVWDELIEQVGS